MKNMTIGRKVSVLCAVLMLLSIGVGFAGLVNVARMKAFQESTVADAMAGRAYIISVRSQSKDIRAQMTLHILSTDQQAKANYESQIAGLHDRVLSAMKDYEKTIFRSEDREQFTKVAPAFERFYATWEPIRAESRKGHTAKAFDLFKREAFPSGDALMALTDAIDQAKTLYGDECAFLAAAAASSANWWIWSVGLFSIGAGGMCCFILVRGLNGSLERNAGELKESAAQIAGAAGQVATSSQALAEGASEQAASIEETSASAEEITAMTRKNEENSQRAAELMGAVDRHVKDGNVTLDQMVSSMDQINGSSEKISRIIKVIDEIAFQTNILALNAAVEAARAGEAGMGFAVVADEVRNLAQRSAQAAKDTSALIEESIATSKEGSSRLGQVTEVIRQITVSAAQVKILVDEVSLGSKEQSRGIEQISKAITHMSQVTQTSAASAEEGASASQELLAQSNAMRGVVTQLQHLVRRNESEEPKHKAVPQKQSVNVKAAAPVEKRKVKVESKVPVFAAARDEFPMDDDFREM